LLWQLGIVVVVAIISALVWSTLRSWNRPKSLHMIVAKIMSV
jgi:hypothetical protein